MGHCIPPLPPTWTVFSLAGGCKLRLLVSWGNETLRSVPTLSLCSEVLSEGSKQSVGMIGGVQWYSVVFCCVFFLITQGVRILFPLILRETSM